MASSLSVENIDQKKREHVFKIFVLGKVRILTCLTNCFQYTPLLKEEKGGDIPFLLPFLFCACGIERADGNLRFTLRFPSSQDSRQKGLNQTLPS